MLIDRLLKQYPAAAVLMAVDSDLKARTEKAGDALFLKDLAGTGINIKKVHNRGMLLGGGKENPPAVYVLTGGLLALFMLTNRKALQGKDSAMKNLSANLITAGAASNLRDRTKYGYVVDYFSLPVKNLRNVYFNLGDLMILGGSLLYAVSGLPGRQKD